MKSHRLSNNSSIQLDGEGGCSDQCVRWLIAISFSGPPSNDRSLHPFGDKARSDSAYSFLVCKFVTLIEVSVSIGSLDRKGRGEGEVSITQGFIKATLSRRYKYEPRYKPI
jgi:hypothetical protein